MAVKVLEVNGRATSYNVRKFLVSTADEIKKLPKEGIAGTLTVKSGDKETNRPCAIGSMAFVISDFKLYILSPDNTWETKK